MAHLQTITPCLWFGGNAAEAVAHYIAIFPDSRVARTSFYGEGGRLPKGEVLVIEFELDRQHFMALNAEPLFPFTEAISLVVNCETQAEIDYYWAKLGDGGNEVACGWLKDKFGLRWQIIPTTLGDMLTDPDDARSSRVMAAMMGMVKLDLPTLRQAYDNPG
ncbi:MAG TPA: VOC family protein [Acetobacteraceae bacterium]|nr:VOC family protein [Acetobacteraceae bacterium]